MSNQVFELLSVENLFEPVHDKVNVLKFQTLVACQNGLDKHCRPRSDCLWRSNLIVCYSDQHFVNSSPENQHFVWLAK